MICARLKEQDNFEYEGQKEGHEVGKKAGSGKTPDPAEQKEKI